MLIATAVAGMKKHRDALMEIGGSPEPSAISEHTHSLAQYIAAVEDYLATMEETIEVKESESFQAHVESGKSPNAAKELVRRELTKERAEAVRYTRLVSSGWKLVSESQSRVKHLIAEASNQI